MTLGEARNRLDQFAPKRFMPCRVIEEKALPDGCITRTVEYWVHDLEDKDACRGETMHEAVEKAIERHNLVEAFS